MQQSKVHSFWNLILIYDITIPIIQRDYAQGRKEVQHVRDEFLRVLFHSLDTGKPIELDFIYGTVNAANQFLPLDGQQRLTTLFLLHWYFALKENKLFENQSVFQKFSYETRLSSKLFYKLLVTLIDLDLSRESLSKQIYNEANFYYGWRHDPTVASMLSMIDSIHKFSRSYNLPTNIFETLTTNSPITFQFIDLDTFHLDDTLYIKMNARGKPLTVFDNFKARLQPFLDEIIDVDGKEILYKIDTMWSDFFWKYHNENYDESFMQFFQTILINHLSLANHNRNRLFNAINKVEYIRFEELSELLLDRESWIRDIEVTLDSICCGELLNQQTVIDVRRIISQAMKRDINYTERVQLYAIVAYLRCFGENFGSFSRWMRFIRNLTINTYYNRVDDYMQSIQTINLLVTHAQNLDYYIADPEMKLTGFSNFQLLQEQSKAQLIVQDEGWTDKLFIAEDHGYFLGDINFLLSFIEAKGLNEWSNDEHKEKQISFINYFEKTKRIFGRSNLNVPANLLSRALLTFGNYLLQNGQNLCFVKEGFDRDTSWKRFFRHPKVRYLKQLLDEINVQSIENDLHRIINESDISDWRKYFIQNPLILEKCCGRNRLIRYYNDKSILLLDTTMTSGYCQEYYSYAIYAALLNKGIACKYEDSVGASNDKFVELKEKTIRLRFLDKHFYIYDSNNQVLAEILDFDEALETISELAS